MNNNIELYKINEVTTHKFYQLPKELFSNPKYSTTTSIGTKIAYAFLLDRLELSKINNWVNGKGEVYLIFTREELMKELCISKVTVTNIFKELNKVGLIFEQKQGQGNPNLIYIGKIEHEEIEIKKTVSNTLENQKFKNYTSRSIESKSQEVKNLNPIYTNNIDTDNILQEEQKHNKFKNTDEENLYYIKKEINLSKYNNEIINNTSLSQILDKAINKLYYMKELKLINSTIPKEKIRSRLYELNDSHIEQVVNIFLEKNNEITNYSGYLSTCIYNSLVDNIVNTNSKFYNRKSKSSVNISRKYTDDFFNQFYHDSEEQELE